MRRSADQLGQKLDDSDDHVNLHDQRLPSFKRESDAELR
jgi:hypothetical protein